jgi:hypothetical protein
VALVWACEMAACGGVRRVVLMSSLLSRAPPWPPAEALSLDFGAWGASHKTKSPAPMMMGCGCSPVGHWTR